MTRGVWLGADGVVGDWETQKRRITAEPEADINWALVDEADVERMRELGDVNIAAFRTDADVHVMEAEEDDGEPAALADIYIIGKDDEDDATVELPPDFSRSADLATLRRGDGLANGSYVRILSKDCEAFAEEAAHDGDYTIVIGEDWTIIPLGNLIACIGEETDLIVGVTTAEKAKTAFETLEPGSDGVLLDSDDSDEIRKTVEVRDEAERESLDLVWVEVAEVECMGIADRVCVDTGTIMDHDEGMPVGSAARGLFFVHAGAAKSPYIAFQPFRVNTGAVHAYVRTPDGDTAYLFELESGDEVWLIDTNGSTREAIVGRVRIEERPTFRISADYEGDRVTTLFQSAETIKVHTREGRTAVTDLEPDDEILIYYEDTACHFDEAIEESTIEK